MSDRNKKQDDERSNLIVALIFFVIISIIGLWSTVTITKKIERFFNEQISVTIEYTPVDPE